jgi:hypothetical protein
MIITESKQDPEVKGDGTLSRRIISPTINQSSLPQNIKFGAKISFAICHYQAAIKIAHRIQWYHTLCLSPLPQVPKLDCNNAIIPMT